MTDAEIDKLNSDELNRLVAEACGIDPYEAKLNGFMPSTDWNDAMRALDRIVGEDESLFPADSVLLECDRAGWFAGLDRVTSWRLGDETNDWKDTPIASVRVGWAYGETGPLAICRAILHSKQER